MKSSESGGDCSTQEEKKNVFKALKRIIKGSANL
jgi:hypothetical protein